MTFDANNIFLGSKQVLLDILATEDHGDRLLSWVNYKSKAGLTKKQIYDVLLELSKDIQTRPDPNDKFYNRLTDFMDGFTTWDKSFKILPDEPDVLS